MTEPERAAGESSTGDDARRPSAASRKTAFGDPDASVLEQMGGVRGLVFSSIPVLTFVPVNAFWGLTAAIWGALGVAVAMLAWSLARRDNPQPAISGFIGVAICVFIAWRTGDAKGYFLYGIITQAVYGSAFALSAIAGWPLVGVIWGFLDGKGMAWRRIPPARRWYTVATGFWAALFAIRAVLQYILYLNDEVNWLGAARIGMGWPLALVAFLGTVWAVRRAMAHEKDAESAVAEQSPGDAARGD
ncbi:DUF3159 domain-containing protein [Dietzia lutea]|uniref:DUF3159 domain-containing protein n=1 Tax=Dietzia lutea TaxID=546160 RepID=A0A2S1R6Z3_9ACTN|nr:DUF3159 domain-containing protein [Dietzia lutea]AWH92024.1 hypothetical protein A6035_07455 [Dietzia lutea]